MISEKNKCIGELSVYGDLKCLLTTDGIFNMDCEFDIPYQAKEPLTVTNILIGDNHFDIELTHESGWSIGFIERYEYLPILHPISNLTKEITHKGYNDDKPFIPLVELAKIIISDYKDAEIVEMNEFSKTVEFYCTDARDSEVKLRKFFYANSEDFIVEDLREGNFDIIGYNTYLKMIDLLKQLHFDTRGLIELGDAVDVNTLDKNPYSI